MLPKRQPQACRCEIRELLQLPGRLTGTHYRELTWVGRFASADDGSRLSYFPAGQLARDASGGNRFLVRRIEMKVRGFIGGLLSLGIVGVTALTPVVASADEPAVVADVAQVTVGNRTTFTIEVKNHGSGIGTIDLRAALPAGSVVVDSFAGNPGENPAANLGDAVGWINMEVPNDRPWGPFVFTIDSAAPNVCTHVYMWYSSGNQSGNFTSPQLCNTAPVTTTPGFGQEMFATSN
jgi:hypothetical protein